jgi:hypothetical protein
MPSAPYGARPASRRGVRAARRGWALVRTVVLVCLTGFLIALVVATIFAGLIIAINGRLPQ